VREVAELQVRREFRRSSAGSSTRACVWVWHLAQGSCNSVEELREELQVLPRELTEVCDEARGWER
jgi:hypothetical protein